MDTTKYGKYIVTTQNLTWFTLLMSPNTDLGT